MQLIIVHAYEGRKSDNAPRPFLLIFESCSKTRLCYNVSMKIKVKKASYQEVEAIKKPEHKQPARQTGLARFIMNTVARSELKAVNFRFEEVGMEKLGAEEPALFLMNHSSFTDLNIAARILKKRQYHIVCTNDGFVGKNGLMRFLGCIPAKKFISDLVLVKDMKYAIDKLGSSILMYPEASYSFDGSETPLPGSLAKSLKLLKVPVVMIKTEGAFLRDPLYNCLQKRQVDVSSTVTYLLSVDDIKNKSVEELDAVLTEAFRYDHFRAQKKAGIKVTEPFRADGLHRALYKCPACLTEGKMTGKGIYVTCGKCGKQYELTEEGTLRATNGTTEYEYVTDWYKFERDSVREELLAHTYKTEMPVDIYILADTKAVYDVGSGILTHDENGFVLKGCDGALEYVQSPKESYSLYSDYYWYEIADVVSIGNTTRQYYCFPKNQDEAIVAKVRLATEELYKLSRAANKE